MIQIGCVKSGHICKHGKFVVLGIIWFCIDISTVSPFGVVDVSPEHHQVSHMTSSVTFTCQSGAGPNLTYNWLINGDVITSDNIEINGSQLIVNNVTHLLGGTYICIVTNQAGVGMSSGDLFGELILDTWINNSYTMAMRDLLCICPSLRAAIYHLYLLT